MIPPKWLYNSIRLQDPMSKCENILFIYMAYIHCIFFDIFLMKLNNQLKNAKKKHNCCVPALQTVPILQELPCRRVHNFLEPYFALE